MSNKNSEDKNPIMNIGLVGHVDHGKTTLTRALSGTWTDTHSEELKRGITIKLGYANSNIYYCDSCKKYVSNEECPYCNSKTDYIHTVSFVDAPGHESLMATMLSGAAIMDYGLLLIAANEECPQPQTREHLMALEIMGLKKIIVVQNKIDLVNREQAIENYNAIKTFLKGSVFEDSPIIPISAQQNANIDTLIETMINYFEVPKRDKDIDPIMYVARSFDVNRPGTKIEDMIGGVLGGAVKQGIFKRGDEIVLKPGRSIQKQNKVIWEPIKTKILDIHSGAEKVQLANPGGSVALSTDLDPAFVQGDRLLGSLVGLEGKMPPVFEKINLEVDLLERVVGSKKDIDVEKLKKSEMLLLNVNSATTVGVVTNILKKNVYEITLKLPICSEYGSRVTISRRIENRFRLIGFGIIKE